MQKYKKSSNKHVISLPLILLKHYSQRGPSHKQTHRTLMKNAVHSLFQEVHQTCAALLPVQDVIAGCGSQQSQCCTPHCCDSTAACLHDTDSLQWAACQRSEEGGTGGGGGGGLQEGRERTYGGRLGRRKMNEKKINLTQSQEGWFGRR